MEQKGWLAHTDSLSTLSECSRLQPSALRDSACLDQEKGESVSSDDRADAPSESPEKCEQALMSPGLRDSRIEASTWGTWQTCTCQRLGHNALPCWWIVTHETESLRDLGEVFGQVTSRWLTVPFIRGQTWMWRSRRPWMDPEQKYKMGEYVSCVLLYNILRNLGNVMTCNRYNVPSAV